MARNPSTELPTPVQIPPTTEATTTANRKTETAPSCRSGWASSATPRAIAGDRIETSSVRPRLGPAGGSNHRSRMRPRYGFATGSSRGRARLSRVVYASGPTLGVTRKPYGDQGPTPRTSSGGTSRPSGHASAEPPTQGSSAPVEAPRPWTGAADRAAPARAPGQADRARGLRIRQPLIVRVRDRGDPEGGGAGRRSGRLLARHADHVRHPGGPGDPHVLLPA